MMSEAATIVSPDAHENRMTETAAAALHQLPEQHYSISSSCREEAREQLCVERRKCTVRCRSRGVTACLRT